MTAATWTPATITIAGPDGEPANLRGFASRAFPGLAVHKHGDGGFGVTHVESGRAIARFLVTRTAAVALIQAIAPLADWSLDAPQLQASEELSRQIWALRSGVYAREEQGDFGPVDHDLIHELNRFHGRREESQPTRELAMKLHTRGHRRH